MDEGPEPERIEIELTSHEPATPTGRSRRAPEGASVETTDPDDLGGPGPLGSERGRLVAVGAAAAVIALSVGVLVGRLGAGEVESSDDVASPTTAATTTTDPDRYDDTLPRAPDVLTPPSTTTVTSTTRRSGSPTSTTDPGLTIVGELVIDRDVPPDPVELVTLTADGEVIRIDVATGAFVSTGGVGTSNGPPAIHAGSGWVLVPNFDPRIGSTVIFDDRSRTTIDLGGWWPSLTGAGDTAFWRADLDRNSGAPTRLVGLAIDGSETGAAIELDGFYPQMSDPLGGVVVQAPGGFYVLAPNSRTRLTTGQLVGLGERRVVVNECDDQLACGYFVVDRATAARTPLVLDPGLGERPAIESGGFWSLRRPMSPDEEALLVVTWDDSGGGRQVIGVLDLVTGEHTVIGAFVDMPQMEWSADSRRVYWLDGGRLKVFDRSTAESVLFSDDLGRLSALTLRPSVAAADESG